MACAAVSLALFAGSRSVLVLGSPRGGGFVWRGGGFGLALVLVLCVADPQGTNERAGTPQKGRPAGRTRW